MDIVFFIQNISRPAGSERVTTIIASEFAKEGNNVTILSICGDNRCFYPLDRRVKLVTLTDKAEINNRKYFLKVLGRYRKYCEHHKIDIVIDVFAALSIYTIILKNKYSFRNITWEHFNYMANVGMNKLGRKMAVKYSDKIVTLTETDRNMYIRNNKGIDNRVSAIFNPSPYQDNSNNYNPNNISDIVANRDDNRENIILSVGRLTEQKGFDRMLRVWKLLREQHNNLGDWKLVILGEGENRQKLEEFIRLNNLTGVMLPGAVKNIDEYYSRAKMYISTSLYEGLPMTMIEAQSFGLPIVTLDYMTGPGDIVRDGQDGFIVDGKDENKRLNDMAGKIYRLLYDEELLKKMSTKAYESSGRFKKDSIMKQWGDVISSLAGI